LNCASVFINIEINLAAMLMLILENLKYKYGMPRVPFVHMELHENKSFSNMP